MSTNFLIAEISLLICPVLAILLFRFLKKNHSISKRVHNGFIAFVIIFFIALILKIRFTNHHINFICVSFILLIIFYFIFWIFQKRNQGRNIFGLIIKILFFGFVYYTATLNVLNIRSLISDFDPVQQKVLCKNYNIKLFSTGGNLLSDRRALKVEINAVFPIIRFLERKKIEKEYYSLLAFASNTQIEYSENSGYKKVIIISEIKTLKRTFKEEIVFE